MEGLSDALGFSYALLMGTTGKYWRVYMGGDPNFKLLLPTEIVALSETLGPNPKTVAKLNDAFSTTSIYLWDVDGDEVTMMSLGKMGSSNDIIADELGQVMHPKRNRDDGSVSTNPMSDTEDRAKPFWNKVIDFIVR